MAILILLFIYWVLCAIYGNKWIQLSIGGVNTFYIIMGIGILYSVYKLLKNEFKIPLINEKNIKGKWFKNVYSYIAIYILYIVLSYMDFFKKFNTNVDFDSSYIIRQSYILFSLPLVYTIIDLIRENKNKLIIIGEKYNLWFFLWILLFLLKIFIGDDIRCYRSVIFAVSTIIVTINKKMLSWIILVFSVLFLCNLSESSTSLLAGVLAFFSLVFSKEVFVTLKNNTKLKIISILGIIVFLVLLIYNGTIEINDVNTIWRLQYWQNEFNVIAKTNFLGIGFGTAYASNSIYSEINNPSVFFSQAEEGKGLFVITQHSSIINAFYRLGVLGGLISIFLLIINPIIWYINLYQINNKWLKLGFSNYIFNFCVILLNPGLESPPFMIGFMFSYAFWVALLLEQSKDFMAINY